MTKADSSITVHDRAYQHDGIGNREKSAESLTLPASNNYTANALNQYTAVDAVNPVYDLDGNATAYPVMASGSTTAALSWDGENRLIGAGTAFTYLYDAQSRLMARNYTAGGGSATVYVYDGWNLIGQYKQSGSLTPALIVQVSWQVGRPAARADTGPLFTPG